MTGIVALNGEAVGIAERVTAALNGAGLTATEAARRAKEIHPKAIRTMIHKAARQGLRPRDPDVRAAFARVLGADPVWLWFGGGRPRAHMLDYIEQGGGEGAAEDEGGALASGELRADIQTGDPAGYALRVEGDAWEPMVSRGNVLYLTPSFPPAQNDRVYVRDGRVDGVYRLGFLGAETVVLISPIGLSTSRSRAGLVIHRIGCIYCPVGM